MQDVRLLFEYSLNALQIYHWTHISQITNITHLCRLCVYSLTTLQIYHWTDVTHITDITQMCVYILWLHFKHFWTHITHITSRHSRVQDVWIPCGHTPDTSGLTLLTLLTLPHYSVTHLYRMCVDSLATLQINHWTDITLLTLLILRTRAGCVRTLWIHSKCITGLILHILLTLRTCAGCE